jgi:sirohydrochlorin ferrochelatase
MAFNKQENKKTKSGIEEAIILLGHGSRVPEAAENMRKTAERLKEKYGYARVEVCFMSRLGPHFPEVFEKCVRQGVTRVLVIPYFLHMGLHLLLDIPKMMQREGQKYPQVELVLGKGLGYDESLVDLVHLCIQKSLAEEDVRKMILPPEENFPIPHGQYEFVPMLPEEAAEYRRNRGK